MNITIIGAGLGGLSAALAFSAASAAMFSPPPVVVSRLKVNFELMARMDKNNVKNALQIKNKRRHCDAVDGGDRRDYMFIIRETKT